MIRMNRTSIRGCGRDYRPQLEALEDRTLLSVCTVTRLSDTGTGKGLRGDFRYCIGFANDNAGPDVINFTVTGNINLNSALPILEGRLRIVGPGADVLTVRRDSSADFRIFKVAGPAVYISGLTLSNGRMLAAYGKPNHGGAIYNNSGSTLVLDSCTVSGNTVVNYMASGTDVYAGGIYNKGSILMINSTVSKNVAYSDWDSSWGGGINNAKGATLRISHTTITKNDGGWGVGGGILTWGTLHMRNTILAGNTIDDFGGYAPDLYGNLTTSGYNLIGSKEGGSGFSETDIYGKPNLGPLADNGGPTFTHALLPGSRAIDSGDNTGAPQWDQRGPGYPRIVNGRVDIGAFEVQNSGMPGADWGLTPAAVGTSSVAHQAGDCGEEVDPGTPSLAIRAGACREEAYQPEVPATGELMHILPESRRPSVLCLGSDESSIPWLADELTDSLRA